MDPEIWGIKINPDRDSWEFGIKVLVGSRPIATGVQEGVAPLLASLPPLPKLGGKGAADWDWVPAGQLAGVCLILAEAWGKGLLVGIARMPCKKLAWDPWIIGKSIFLWPRHNSVLFQKRALPKSWHKQRVRFGCPNSGDLNMATQYGNPCDLLDS